MVTRKIEETFRRVEKHASLAREKTGAWNRKRFMLPYCFRLEVRLYEEFVLVLIPKKKHPKIVNQLQISQEFINRGFINTLAKKLN